MFALEKVPKILTLLHTFFLSLMMSILSLSCCGCKHGRLKSQFSPASVLHLFSQFDLLLFSLTRGWGALHARTHAYSYKCIKKGARAILHFPKKGVVSVWDFFLYGEVFRSQSLCAMERVSDVQNNRGGKECYAQFFLHYYKTKNEEAFKSSMFDAGIVRFLLLHSIYCMYQNIYYLRGSL